MGWEDALAPIPIVGGLFQGGRATKPIDTSQTDEDRARAIDAYNTMMGERGGYSAAAPVIGSAGVTAPTIDNSRADEIRGQQTGYLSSLEAAVNGGVASPAEIAMAQQQKAIAEQQTGLAGMAHGTAGVSARRDAAHNIAMGEQNAGLNAALLRAQEQATARAQLGGALTGVRGQDTQAAQFGATQQLQAGMTNAELAQRAAEANARANLEAQRLTQQTKLGLGGQALDATRLGQGATAEKLGVLSGNRKSALDLYSASLSGAASGAAAFGGG